MFQDITGVHVCFILFTSEGRATLWTDPTHNKQNTGTLFWIGHESCGIHQFEHEPWLYLLNLTVLRIVGADRPLRSQDLIYEKREAATAS